MAEVGRNQPCPCGSGRKYKHCCALKEEKPSWAGRHALVLAGLALLAVGVLLALSLGRPSQCPPGQVWSAQHGHCH